MEPIYNFERLVSVQSRYNQVVDESSSTGKALTDWYKEHNIAIYDQQGQLLNLYDVLEQVSEIWTDLTKNEQSYYLNQQAGANQTQNLAAILSNFDTAIEATTTALNSAGSAAQENSAHMSSLEAQTSKVKATFQDLANNVISNELVGSLLTLADVFLQFVNTPIGTFVTQVVLLTGAISGLISVLKAMDITSVVANQFSNLAQIVKNLTFVMSGASGPLVATSGIMGAFIPIALGVSAAIAGIIAVLPYASDWYKEFTNDVDYANDKLEESNNKLETNKERLEALYNVPVANRTAAIWEEIEALEEENAELEKNIEYWTQKGIQGTLDDLRQAAYETQAYIVKGYDSPFTEWVTSEEEAIERLKEWGYEYENLGDKIEDFGFTLEELGQDVYVDDETYLKKLVNAQEDLQEKIQSGTELTAEEAEQYSKNNAILEERQEIYEANIKQGNKLNSVEEAALPTIQNLTSNYDTLIGTLYDTDEILDLVTQGYNLNDGQAQVLINTYPELSGVIQENNGVWELNRQKLYEVAAAGNESARQMVRDQIELTQDTISNINARIQAYYKELSILNQITGTFKTSSNPFFSTVGGFLSEASQLFPSVPTELLNEAKNAGALLNELKYQVSSWDSPLVAVDKGDKTEETTTSPKKTTTTTKDKQEKEEEVDIIEEQSKAFEEQNAIMEHNIYLREQQGASEEELIKLNQQYQNELHKQAEWYRGQGLDDTSEYIRDTQKQWWSLQNDITGYEDDITDNARDNFDKRLELSEDYIKDRNDFDDWGADSEIAAYKRILAWMDQYYADGLIDYEYYAEKRAEKARELSLLEKEAEEQAFEDARDAFDERLQISEDYIQDRNDLDDWGTDNEIAAYQRVLDWMDEYYAEGLIDYEHYWENRWEIQKKKIILEKQEEERLFQERRDIFDDGLEEYEQYIQDRNDFDDWGTDNEIATYQRMMDWMDEQYAQDLIDYEYYWEKKNEIARKQALLAKQQAEEAWKAQKEAEIDTLEKRQEALETLFSLVTDKAQEEIDLLNEQKEEITNRYQAQIDALQEVNDELDDQIEKEEALDALARARQTKVMVYKDGRFQYVQDIDKVSEAQANLEKIKREEVLEKEVSKLEELRDQEIASIDEQIEYWEKYKEEWSSVVSDYQKEQDKLLVLQELGIDLEGENWETRLGNLSSYITQYKNLLAELARAQEELNQGFQNDSMSGALGGTSSSGGITPGTGSLAGTEYNAWAKVPGVGYVPVTVENGKTQQWGLPAGTIIYGNDTAWKITGGGESSGDPYTSEVYGPTPSEIWTPGKESSSSSGGGGSSGSSSGDSYMNEPPLPGGSGSSSRPSSGSSSSSSKPSSGGNYTGSSTTGGPGYNIGSQAGKDFINNAKPGSTLTGGDGSSWTKNPDGSTTINRGDDTWVVPAHAMGTLDAQGGLSLVGEEGPELRVLNSGDGIIPNNITKNLMDIGKYSARDLLNGGSSGTVVHIASLTLPGIKDSQEFIQYFNSSLWRKTLQYKTGIS